MNRQNWAFMKRFDIPDAGDPTRIYLRRRRIIQTPWFALYLHHIYMSDGDRDPHDHPWPFSTLVLRGGYSEVFHPVPNVDVSRSTVQTWRRFSLHRMRLHTAHRIVQLKPNTVTLVFVGHRQRSWGFYTPYGFLDWKEYPKLGMGPDPFDS